MFYAFLKNIHTEKAKRRQKPDISHLAHSLFGNVVRKGCTTIEKEADVLEMLKKNKKILLKCYNV